MLPEQNLLTIFFMILVFFVCFYTKCWIKNAGYDEYFVRILYGEFNCSNIIWCHILYSKICEIREKMTT